MTKLRTLTSGDFSIHGLESRLLELIELGFTFSGDFQDTTVGKVFLRHDVDFSLEAALRVAQAESKLGISSTFFVLVTSDAYNLFAQKSKDTMVKLLELGHKVGLHFDAESSRYNLASGIELQASLLEAATSTPVTLMSQHRPTANGFIDHDSGSLFDVRKQVASSESSVRYVSDSGGYFSYGDYRHRPLDPREMSLQLLLHPIWWESKESLHPMEVLTNFGEGARVRARQYSLETVGRYSKELDVKGSGWPAGVR